MENEVEGQRHVDEEKAPLQDLDISNIIFIRNPNNEVALGNILI
jgi:hypothetical protein